MAGAEALVTTLLAYGLTELVGGYGFLAVFVAALVLRRYEWAHDYHRELHDFAAIVERLLMAAVLVLFGGAVAGGLLAPLTLAGVAVSLAILCLVRPLSGLLAFSGFDASLADRTAVSWFGIRVSAPFTTSPLRSSMPPSPSLSSSLRPSASGRSLASSSSARSSSTGSPRARRWPSSTAAGTATLFPTAAADREGCGERERFSKR